MKQQQRYPQSTYKEASFDWRGMIAGVALFACVYFTGPLVFICLLLQLWAASSLWRAPDRWASLRTFAWLCPLLYLPTWLLWHQIAFFWNTHLPGEFLLWPPTFGAIFARSVLALPLAPALTLLLERQSPRTLTMRSMIRRPRPGEVIGPTQQATWQEQEEEPRQLAPAPLVSQVQHPAEAPASKISSGTEATKPTSVPGSSPTRKRREPDPRPGGVVWAEQAEAERRNRAAQSQATRPLVQSEQQAAQKAMEPEEDLSEEPARPDPFKAKKVDWSKVKE